MPQRKLDLLFWGYIATVLHSLLKPYQEGRSVLLNEEDKETIRQSERLLDSILKGCDTIDSPGKLSFAHETTELPSATALSLAIDIFLAMAVEIPDDLEGFKKKLNDYRSILENLRNSRPLQQSDIVPAQEVSAFFKTLGNKADQESYEAAYSF